MESKLKAQAQDSVGELPNLLLRECGYPHLPTTPIKQDPQVTDWISGDILPTIDGVYERKYNYGTGAAYSKFKNGFWYCWNDTVDKASETVTVAFSQNLKWRGLSSNPNEVQS
jgi:hypothetical protein